MKTWERAVMLRRSFLSLPPPPYAIPSEGRGFPRLPLRYSRMAAAVRQACRKST